MNKPEWNAMNVRLYSVLFSYHNYISCIWPDIQIYGVNSKRLNKEAQISYKY